MFLLKASESNYSPSDNTNPKYSTQKPGADTWYSYWVWHVTHSCSFKISNIRVIIRDNNTLSTWYLSRSITLTILLSIAQYATIKTIADRLKTFDNRQTISLKTEEFMMARRTLSQSSDTSRHIIVDRRGDKSLRTMVWLTVRGETRELECIQRVGGAWDSGHHIISLGPGSEVLTPRVSDHYEAAVIINSITLV